MLIWKYKITEWRTAHISTKIIKDMAMKGLSFMITPIKNQGGKV
jgi:hypothetical protein